MKSCVNGIVPGRTQALARRAGRGEDGVSINRSLGSALVDEFDKAMALLVLLGFSLAAYRAYGSWRLNQIRASDGI